MSGSHYNRLHVGVLALQGAFAKHLEVLQSLGVPGSEVRNPEDLLTLDGLIIPGGETSTMLKLMRSEQWIDRMKAFGDSRPVFGTCAGMILMGTRVDDSNIISFGWMPIRVRRNAYGAQVNSFQDVGSVSGMDGGSEMEMIFIRAPRLELLSDDVQILGTCRNEPVMVQYGSHLATAFHPELTPDTRTHRYWLDRLVPKLSSRLTMVRLHESAG